ncbi:MAG: hypothetical protein ACP5HZ_10750 [Ferrimicrobium sp.]
MINVADLACVVGVLVPDVKRQSNAVVIAGQLVLHLASSRPVMLFFLSPRSMNAQSNIDSLSPHIHVGGLSIERAAR